MLYSWLIETWDVLKFKSDFSALTAVARLIETWDVLKYNQWGPARLARGRLIETWDVLKSWYYEVGCRENSD